MAQDEISRAPVTVTVPRNQLLFFADVVGGSGPDWWGHVADHYGVTVEEARATYDMFVAAAKDTTNNATFVDWLRAMSDETRVSRVRLMFTQLARRDRNRLVVAYLLSDESGQADETDTQGPERRQSQRCVECGGDLTRYGDDDRWYHVGTPEPDHLAMLAADPDREGCTDHGPTAAASCPDCAAAQGRTR